MLLALWLVSSLRDAITSHFLLLWLLSLICIVVTGYWLGRKSLFLLPRSSQPVLGSERAPLDVGALVFFGLFLVFYITMMLYKEDFAFLDNDQLTDFSVSGRALPAPIWPAEGRFFPLAFQEFNVLRFLTRSPAGYQLLAAVQLLICLLVLSAVLRQFRLRYRLMLLSALMLAPSFSMSFTGLVYPERNVLFWLALLMFCFEQYSKTRAPGYFVASLVGVHFALYYKETLVLFIVASAASCLLVGFYREPSVRSSWPKFCSENALSLSLLAVCAVYVAFFLATMAPWSSAYVAEHQQRVRSVLQTYLVIDWLPWLLLTVFLWRVLRRAPYQKGLDPLWDSLAVGALAYFFSILALRLISGYYLAPVDLVALIYLGRLALSALPAAPKVRIALLVTAFVCLVAHDGAYSSFRIVERKSLILASRQLADFLGNYLQGATGQTVRLYFPYATGHQLLTLSAYFKYRGLPLAQVSSANPKKGPELLVESPAEFTSNRCTEYGVYTCLHADRANPGALVIVMPDDHVTMSDVGNVATNAALLFRLRPPKCCDSRTSWLRLLYVISPEFAATGLSDHWPELDVFEMKPGAVPDPLTGTYRGQIRPPPTWPTL